MVGLLVGTLEPARVMVTIAQANNASATTNTAPPSQRAGTAAGRNGKGISQSSAKPAMTASAHASGGRMTTWAVAALSLLAGPPSHRAARLPFVNRLLRTVAARCSSHPRSIDAHGDTMTALSLTQADGATEVAKITIAGALKARWHAATRKQNGSYEIDTVAPAAPE